MADIPAISGVDDPANVRVMLLQGKQQVNAPLTGLGFLPLDGSLPMTGDLDMGTHNIANATDITAVHLKGTSTASNSLTVNDQPLTLGDVAGLNIIASRSGLVARNNGAASSLNLNTLGGPINLGGTGSTVTIAAAGALVLPQAAAPVPTVEGSMAWDTDEDVFRIGTGSTTKQIGIATGAVQATTSGTSKTFSSIPAGTKRITLMIGGVSTNGTNNLTLTLGDAGGIESSGYLGGKAVLSTSAVAASSSTGAFIFGANTAAHVIHGTLTLTLLDPATFYWTCQGSVSSSASDATIVTSGSKALSQELNQIQISAGGDTFDAGSINIMYE